MYIFSKALTALLVLGANSMLIAMDGEPKKQANQRSDGQYGLEQDSKRRAAQINAEALDRELVAQFQEEERVAQLKDMQLLVQDEESGKEIRAWLVTKGQDKQGNKLEKLASLPMPLLQSVVEFRCGNPQKLKFLACNMDKLMPAVLEWDPKIFYEINYAKDGLLVTYKKCKTAVFHKNGSAFAFTHMGPENFSHIKDDPNSFIAYSFPFNKIVFKVCPKKFKSLEGLSIEQLTFLASLYDQYSQVIASAPRDNGIQITDNGIQITRVPVSQEQQKLYAGLPKEIRDCLNLTYGYVVDAGTSMPLEMTVYIKAAEMVPNNQIDGQ